MQKICGKSNVQHDLVAVAY